MNRVSSEDATERPPSVSDYFLVDATNIIEEDTERVFAAYDAVYSPNNHELEEYIAENDVEIEADELVKYIDLPKRESQSLADAANGAAVLIHHEGQIISKARLGNRTGKRVDGTNHNIITLFGYRDIGPSSFESVSPVVASPDTAFQEIDQETYEKYATPLFDSSKGQPHWQPSNELEYRATWLKDRYHDARNWDQLKDASTQTSSAVRRLAEALVDERAAITTEDLTALFRLCQHSGQILVETKR